MQLDEITLACAVLDGAAGSLSVHIGGITSPDAKTVHRSITSSILAGGSDKTAPEWAAAYDVGDDQLELAKIAAELRSKVTFDVETQGEYGRLMVVHGGFESGSAVLPGISDDWPLLLSSLKTLLETGEALRPARNHYPVSTA